MTSISSITRLLILQSISLTATSFSFTLQSHKSLTFSPVRTISTQNFARIRHTTILSSAEGDEKVTAENIDEAEAEAAPAEEKPKEDPEITAIKEEISKLESQLKGKKIELSRVKDEIEDYSEKGYMRKCAEMDNVRRMRASADSDNKISARAVVLQNFLPILDTLRELDEKYTGDDFAKSYSALKWDFENSLKSFDVSEFSADVGEKINRARMAVVAEEYSADVAKGCVVRVERAGVEVLGNVIRMADVVYSLGSEEEAMKEAEEKAKKEAEAKAKAEAEEAETEESEAES